MKTTLFVAAFAAMGFSAQAQNNLNDKVWIAMNPEVLNMELGLNDKQQTEVKEIDTRFAKKHEALENMTPKPTDQQMGEEVEALMVARDKDMRGVLNDEQYAKWEKKRHMGTSEVHHDEKEKMKQ